MRYSGPAGVSVPGDSPRETTQGRRPISCCFPFLLWEHSTVLVSLKAPH